MRAIRHIGIAFGSLVAAWLAVSLVGGVLLGTAATGSVVAVIITVILGGLVYQDIIRKDRRSACPATPAAQVGPFHVLRFQRQAAWSRSR